MGTGTCILLCALSFFAGEILAIVILAILSANREDNDYDNK